MWMSEWWISPLLFFQRKGHNLIFFLLSPTLIRIKQKSLRFICLWLVLSPSPGKATVSSMVLLDLFVWFYKYTYIQKYIFDVRFLKIGEIVYIFFPNLLFSFENSSVGRLISLILLNCCMVVCNSFNHFPVNEQSLSNLLLLLLEQQWMQWPLFDGKNIIFREENGKSVRSWEIKQKCSNYMAEG